MRLAIAIVVRSVVIGIRGGLKSRLSVSDKVLRNHIKARLNSDHVLQVTLRIRVIEGGAGALNSTTDRVEVGAATRTVVHCHVRVLALVRRVITTNKVTIEYCAAIEITIVKAILYKRALTYCRHETRVALRHVGLVLQISA